MKKITAVYRHDYTFILGICIAILLSLLSLHSIANYLFPTYYLYIFLSILAFFIALKIDFDILSVFSKHIYIACCFFLTLPLIIGQVTRGAIRWIPLGPLSIQPSEIVRPFLLIFFAVLLTQKGIDINQIVRSLILLIIPLGLILVQPSLGVAILTLVGFVGVLLASDFNKKYLLVSVVIIALISPVIWRLLAPYQRLRLIAFFNPWSDPYGAGYNSIQSMISVGSGGFFGKGLGRGVQTQLAFLPERHTDFIFAAISEELGFVGAALTLFILFFILWRLTRLLDHAKTPAARAFVSGLFLALFIQTVVHIGMNLGLLPITGVPLPLFSAGGSSFLATMISLALALGVGKIVLT